ncbi:MAG: hypothetical protein MUE78_13230 [Ilumatobacteraceae bacterium]|nr:hypothetical protein [Ilumatobacteraceae bacterium]
MTDSNRDQARQWRSSQDTRGFTESGGPDTDVLRPDTADQRLAVQSDAAADQTVALQDGPVTARATAYGEPFAYRPEDRAAMAIDGDPATAWRVADRADAVGEAIELTSDEPLTTLELVQPGLGVTGRPVTRWITAVDVAVDDAEPVRVTLDERSRAEPGQRVDLPTAGRRVRLTVAETAEALREGAGPDAVGFAEIRTGRGPTTEIVRVPSIPATGAPTDVVLTRWRVDPADRWRHDPEPTLRRRLDLPTAITGAAPTATVRLDPRASDRAIADLLGADVAVASARLTGMPNAGGWAATDGDPATAWIGPFDVADGLSVTVPVAAGTIDTLRLRQPGGDTSPITKVRLTGVGGPVEADVPPADAEGWSTLVTGGLAVDTVLTIELVDVDVRTTRDRRSAEVVGLPVAIAELEGAGITPRPLPDTVSFGCRDDLVTVDGEPLAVDLGSPSTEALIAGDPVVAGACDAATVDLPAGTVEIATAPGALTALDVDRIVLRDPRPTATTPRPSIELLERGRLHRVAEVGACPDGCWIVLGEGLNPGWSASLDGASLGDPVLVDGGFHGWWLEPAAQPRTVRFEWGEQRPVTLGLAISAVAVAVCIVLAVADRRRRPTRLRTPPRLAGIGRETGPGITGSRWWAPAPLAAVVALALLGPVWAAAAAVLGLVAGRLGRPRLLAVAGLAIWIGIGLLMVRRVVVYAPFPGPGWPGEFADLHDLGVFVLALLAGSLSAPDRRPRVGSIPLS